MPFSFTFPTTSSVLLLDYYDSVTHPSLPLDATTQRSVMKDALKKHKRLSVQAKTAHLTIVHDAIQNYLPYLHALNAGSGYRDVGPEKVDVVAKRPLEVVWRSTLAATLPGREPPRPKLTGLHHEIAFTLSTLAYVHTQLARSQLRLLYGSETLAPEQRVNTIGVAIKHLLEAYSIHSYLASLPSISAAQDSPIDVQPSTISALASLARAEADMILVSKDDPYAAAVADERNESNTDWMFKAPTINAKRVRLCATFCLAAADHAAQARALLAPSAGKVDERLVKYAHDARRAARGKALRLLALDAEGSGKTGEALAWLKGARQELGFSAELEDGRRKGLRGLKQSWLERREDRRIERGAEWGLDAGRYEEMRVVEALEAKWDRENSTVNVQAVPALEPLLARMPAPREYPYHQIKSYVLPALDAETFARMRAPPEPNESVFRGEEDDSGDESRTDGDRVAPVGAFPGLGVEYGRGGTSQGYY